MIPEQTVDTATVARFLLLSPHRVRQLTAEGILEKAHDEKNAEPLRGRFNLLRTVNSYIRYLRSKLAGRAGTVDEYTLARARRMSALADIEQLRLKRIHGKLHRAEDVEFLLTQMITACRQRVLAIPSRCAPYLAGKTNVGEIAEAIRVEVYDALRELSEYDPRKFEAANEEYLASIGVAKPEAQADRDKDGTFLSSGPDVVEGT
jgi:phage terminase Nu1 subunit (DNA packaging protein)